MATCIGDLIRLFDETDWHEVIGVLIEKGFPVYEISDGRFVRDMKIESVLEDESDADLY